MATLEKLVDEARTSITKARQQLEPLDFKYRALSGIDSAKDACTGIVNSLREINASAYREARHLRNADTSRFFDDPLKDAIDSFDNDFSPALAQIASSEEFTNPENIRGSRSRSEIRATMQTSAYAITESPG
jgi:hypothetical protein